MSTFQQKKGLTLVETLVYVAVLVVVLLGIVASLLFVTRSLGDLKASRDVKNSAIISLDRMTREIKQAESINSGSSVFDSHPGTLVLNTTDSGGSPTTIEFYYDNGVVKIKEGGVYAGDLTLGTATTTSFIVRQITTTSSEGVRVEIDIENLEGNYNKSTTFYATGILRGSYE